jgi:hypothetical protein
MHPRTIPPMAGVRKDSQLPGYHGTKLKIETDFPSGSFGTTNTNTGN